MTAFGAVEMPCFSCWFGGLSVSRAILRACERGSSGSTVLNLRHPSVGSRVTRRDENPVRGVQGVPRAIHLPDPVRFLPESREIPREMPRCPVHLVNSARGSRVSVVK